MDIQILSYIDSTSAEAAAARTAAASNADSGIAGGGFSATLATAQRAMEALAVDFITSQDPETIQKAAELLSSSGNARLQKLGQELAGGASDEADAANTAGPAAAADATASTSSANSAASAGSANSAGSADAADASKASSVLNCPSSLESYFEEAAEEYDVDVALLESIAKAESNFTSDAKSSAGAIGIMQLMPSTASSLGVADSYDAKSNIMGGAKLISQLLDKYDGDISLALAAYNAGSGNVAKYGGIPPFKETQNYVKKVTEYYSQASA